VLRPLRLGSGIAAKLGFVARHQSIDSQVARGLDGSLEMGAEDHDLQQLGAAHEEQVTTAPASAATATYP
jgi:hypothetical protein